VIGQQQERVRRGVPFSRQLALANAAGSAWRSFSSSVARVNGLTSVASAPAWVQRRL
jgi:hypothetical protein